MIEVRLFLCRLLRGAFAAGTLCLSLAAAAEPSAIEKGVAWLSAQPQADGRLRDEAASIAIASQSRAEALAALAQLATVPPALAQIVAADPSTPTELRARRAVALAAAGRDASALVAAILAQQSPTGGFAPAPGYQPTVYDTAWALLACRPSACASERIASALAYLKAAAATDGSFGISGESSISTTATALWAMQLHRQSADVGAQIAAARGWLLSKQVEGHYATTAEDAIATIALSSIPDEYASFAAAQAALRADQDADGSWQGDPFLTALALRALAAPTPPGFTGLVIEDPRGQPLQGARVAATGPQNASALTDAAGAFTIAGLPAGNYTVEFSLDGYVAASLNAPVISTRATDVGTVRLRLSPTAAVLEGTVRDGATSAPIANAAVSVLGAASTVTGSTGAYRIVGLTAGGTATITVSKAGYQTVTGTGPLVAGGVLVFSPSLYAGQSPTTATVSGRVVDSQTDAGIAGASVAIGTKSATADSNGAFAIAELAPGSVSVSVTASGYQAKTFSGTVAAGANDVGTLRLAPAQATFTLRGRISDRGSSLPIGGASVRVGAATTSTDNNGNYALAGLAQADFVLDVAAAGYTSRQVAVSLPSIADSTADVALDRIAPTTALTLRSVTVNPGAYDAFGGVEIEAELLNTGTQVLSATVLATILDSQQRIVDVVPSVAVQPGADPSESLIAFVPNVPREVEMEWNNRSMPAGVYTALVRVADAAGFVIAEGSTSFTVNPTRKLGGGIALDPPLALATGAPVKIKANLFNVGNVDLAEGDVQLTVTLETPNPNVSTSPETGFFPITTGGSISNPAGITRHPDGTVYVVERNTRQVLKLTPDDVAAPQAWSVSLVAQLPASYSSPSRSVDPIGIAVAPNGTLYVINNGDLLIRIAPGQAPSPILIAGLLTSTAVDVEPGTPVRLLVSQTTGNEYLIARVDPDTGASVQIARNGLAVPHDVVIVGDATYVTNNLDNTVMRVDSQGILSSYATLPGCRPRGMAADGGTLYTACSDGTVRKIVAKDSVSVHASGLGSLLDVGIAPGGALLVLDETDKSVKKIEGGSVVPFAQALATNPEGMRYDAAGNLWIAGSTNKLVRLSPSDQVKEFSFPGSVVAGVEAGSAAGTAFVVDNFSRRIAKVTGEAINVSFVTTGLAGPTGIARRDTTLYVTDTTANRIVSVPEAGGTVARELDSLVTDPFDVIGAGPGEAYVLNATTIARSTAAGGQQDFVTGLSNAAAFARSADGGFVVQQPTAIRKAAAGGGLPATLNTAGLPTLATGVATDPSGGVYFAFSGVAQLKTLNAGAAVNVATTPALASAPTLLTGDGTGAVYAVLANNSVVSIAAGSRQVTVLATITGVNRIAFDAVSQRLYYTTSSGIAFLDTTRTPPIAPSAFATKTGLQGIGMAPSGKVLAVERLALKVHTYATAGGTPESVLVGFTSPAAIVWDGTRFVFKASQGMFSWAPGSPPELLNDKLPIYLAAQGGSVYATLGDSRIHRLEATQLQPFLASIPLANAKGIAARSAGGFALSSGVPNDHRVVVVDANGTQLASYAGFTSPRSMAVAGDGTVYVANALPGQLVRIDPTGRRSDVVASLAFQVQGLAIDAGGRVLVAESTSVSRFENDFALPRTVIGTSTGTGGLVGIAASGGQTFAVDQGAAVLRKLVGTQFVAFATGIGGVVGVRAGANGAIFAASSAGSVARYVAGEGFTTLATDLGLLQAIGLGASGTPYVSNSSGRIFAVAATGPLELAWLDKLIDGGADARALFAAPDETLYFTVPDYKHVARMTIKAPPAGIAPGTIVLQPTRHVGRLVTDAAGAEVVDFGEFIPPKAGDYRFVITPATPGVTGMAVNTLHVGAAAQGAMRIAGGDRVAPGDARVQDVSVSVTGSDFTARARMEIASLSSYATTVAAAYAIGSNIVGEVFYLSGANFEPLPTSNTIRKVSPSGADTVYYSPASPSSPVPAIAFGMRGEIPVDTSGNIYLGNSQDREVVRIAPNAASITRFSFASISNDPAERIVSMTINGLDEMFVLTTTRILKLVVSGSTATWSHFATSVTGNPWGLTIDGAGNLYALHAPSAGGMIRRYRPDGAAASVAVDIAEFEREGSTIAGDCADNLFVAPRTWARIGQSGEESHLAQVIGATGALGTVINGKAINAFLDDIDTLAYDRFSQSLLVWNHRGTGFQLFRMKVSCGGIDAEVRVVFPAGQDASGFNSAPSSRTVRADGSVEYAWKLSSTGAKGQTIRFDTVLPGLRFGDSRGVASEAALLFRNPHDLANEVRVPLTVPVVGVDSQTTLTVASDKDVYGANETVNANATVTRSAFAAQAATAVVEVFDSQKVLMSAFPPQSVTLPATGDTTIPATFFTGSALTGSYVLRVTVNDASGLKLASNERAFDIATDPNSLASSVSTDRAVYDPFGSAFITARAKNLAVNSIASGLSVAVTITRPDATTLALPPKSLAPLGPQGYKDSIFAFALQGAAPGTYNVREQLLDAAGVVLDAKDIEFAVLSTALTGSGLRGALVATRKVNPGGVVSLKPYVENKGNAAAEVAGQVRVVNAAGGVVKTFDFTRTLGRDESCCDQAYAWTATEPGTYGAVLAVTVGGNSITIAQEAITVSAVPPFSFAPRTNVPPGLVEAVESDEIEIAGVVAPAPISVSEGGEFRIGSGGWTARSDTFVNPGDRVAVRVPAPADYNASVTIKLKVSGTEGAFTVATKVADVDPDPFPFAAKADQVPGALVESNEQAIRGIDIAVPISISGGGQYRLGTGDWTDAPGMVAPETPVRVRIAASTTPGASVSTTLRVSNATSTFSVSTTAVQANPTPFAFGSRNAVARDTLIVSDPATISGINTRIPIRVTGGEYRVNAGDFTTTPGDVGNGDVVVVRVRSSTAFDQTTTVTLTVGTMEVAFAVTTEGEDRTPDAIVFAPKTDVAIQAQVASEAVTIKGINVAVPIRIAGGEYQVNSQPFTSNESTVEANDTVRVRLVSSSSFATPKSATLTVGAAQAAFTATTKSVADVTTAPAPNGDARLLVLLSCHPDGHEDDEDAACGSARHALLDQYLASLGYSHKIVTTTDAFRLELRSGRYNAYWIAGGAKKLKDNLAEEVREAAFRGETLVLDGVHDERNKDLDPVAGVRYKGKPSHLDTVTLTGAFLPSGSFDVAGGKAVRFELTTGVRQARFNTGDPAIATNAFGYGKALLFAFDLAGTLQAQPASTLLRSMLDQSLEHVTPEVAGSVTGGAYVPITIALRNAEPVAIDLEASIALPAGFALVSGAPPAIVTGSQVTWTVHLEAGATKTLEAALRAPEASGTYSVPVAIRQGYASTFVNVGTYPIAIVVKGLDTELGKLKADLQALSLAASKDRSARDNAVALLAAAQTQVSQARWEDAIGSLVDATGKISEIGGVDAGPYRAAGGNLVKEVERRWWETR